MAGFHKDQCSTGLLGSQSHSERREEAKLAEGSRRVLAIRVQRFFYGDKSPGRLMGLTLGSQGASVLDLLLEFNLYHRPRLRDKLVKRTD